MILIVMKMIELISRIYVSVSRDPSYALLKIYYYKIYL